MSEKKQAKELSEIGEFGLIELLTQQVKLKNPSTLLGVGDDAAVLNHDGKRMVVTTDMLIEGIHFNLMYQPLKHLGYKSVVVNLSDVFAMNAIPSQITVSIAISNKYRTEMVEELYEGIHLACERFGVDLVGGDTTSSLTGMAISITAIGYEGDRPLAYRSGAKKNDLVCVSGDLGGAYAGLQLLERERSIFEKGGAQPQLEDYHYILERQLKPEARGDIIQRLGEADVKINSMIDISDGLSSEILHICKDSKTGCRLYVEKIPVASETRKMAEEFELEPITFALNGGEDYELLFTVPMSEYEKIEKVKDVSIIGHISEMSEGTLLVTPDNSVIEITSLGWNSFKY